MSYNNSQCCVFYQTTITAVVTMCKQHTSVLRVKPGKDCVSSKASTHWWFPAGSVGVLTSATRTALPVPPTTAAACVCQSTVTCIQYVWLFVLKLFKRNHEGSATSLSFVAINEHITIIYETKAQNWKIF